MSGLLIMQKIDQHAIPTAFATCSIGCKPEHTVPRRLEAIAASDFTAIELSFPDILSHANAHLQREVTATDYDALCTAAAHIKSLCDDLKLEILMLQPFANYEGWPPGSEGRADAERRAAGWIRIMKACGTQMLQVNNPLSANIFINDDDDNEEKRVIEFILLTHSRRWDRPIPQPRSLISAGSG